MTGASGLFGQVGVDPSVAQANLYEQIRATQRPEEQRQALALEERMLSQGRLGLSSDAYGGATPEMLAQQTAIQEARSRANLGARTQAMAEQKQALDAATGMMTQGYKPQEQALAALGYGIQGGQLADVGRRTGSELYGKLGQSGLEAMINMEELATGLETGQRDALVDVFLGSQPTIAQQIAATQAGMTAQQIQNLGSSGLISSGINALSSLLGGTPSTSSSSLHLYHRFQLHKRRPLLKQDPTSQRLTLRHRIHHGALRQAKTLKGTLIRPRHLLPTLLNLAEPPR